MVNCCVAYKCRVKAGEGFSFHKFPIDKMLSKAWCIAMRRKDFTPTIHSRLCSKHFREEDYLTERFGPRTLKDGAVPSIFQYPLFGTSRRPKRILLPKRGRKILSARSKFPNPVIVSATSVMESVPQISRVVSLPQAPPRVLSVTQAPRVVAVSQAPPMRVVKVPQGLMAYVLSPSDAVVKKTTSLDHFLNLEVKVNTGVPESDHDMAKVPAITIKEEPMSDPEDNAPSLGAPTSTTPSLTSVTSLAKFSASSGPGEILGLPFGDLPTGPGSPPPSKSPSVASEVSNARLEKNRFLPSRSPTNESGEQAKLVSDYKRRDQFDVYGEYIASKLRRLDRRTCAHVQRAFGDIIFEAEMGKYR